MKTFTSLYSQSEVLEITPVSTKLKTNTSEIVLVMGSANVSVEYDDAFHTLLLLVAKGNGQDLYGRD